MCLTKNITISFIIVQLFYVCMIVTFIAFLMGTTFLTLHHLPGEVNIFAGVGIGANLKIACTQNVPPGLGHNTGSGGDPVTIIL